MNLRGLHAGNLRRLRKPVAIRNQSLLDREDHFNVRKIARAALTRPNPTERAVGTEASKRAS